MRQGEASVPVLVTERKNQKGSQEKQRKCTKDGGREGEKGEGEGEEKEKEEDEEEKKEEEEKDGRKSRRGRRRRSRASRNQPARAWMMLRSRRERSLCDGIFPLSAWGGMSWLPFDLGPRVGRGST